MGFMEAFKRLEKLCNDTFGDIHGIKRYIDAMNETPMGDRHVPGWEKDMKQLKHYLWVRNQIAHEPDCTEETMCREQDTLWLENFRQRMCKQTDPLSLYRKATKEVWDDSADRRKGRGALIVAIAIILYFFVVFFMEMGAR